MQTPGSKPSSGPVLGELRIRVSTATTATCHHAYVAGDRRAHDDVSMNAMSNPNLRIRPEDASNNEYDAVIVGSGVAGSIVAKELAQSGFRVLVMEAAPGN